MEQIRSRADVPVARVAPRENWEESPLPTVVLLGVLDTKGAEPTLARDRVLAVRRDVAGRDTAARP